MGAHVNACSGEVNENVLDIAASSRRAAIVFRPNARFGIEVQEPLIRDDESGEVFG